MKYIIVEFKQGTRGGETITRRFPFIFPEGVVHKDMYEAACDAIRHETVDNKHTNGGFYAHDFKAVSAGSVSSAGLNALCGGYSETLGVKAGCGDSEFISGMDYHHGIVS